MPLVIGVSALNFFILFSSLHLIPITFLYKLLYVNDVFILMSLSANFYFAKKYFNYLHNYQARVKAMYLLPNGSNIILEMFNGAVNKLENYDIYEYKITNNYEDLRKNNKSSIWINNENSFRCRIGWGMARESIAHRETRAFCGRRIPDQPPCLHSGLRARDFSTAA